MLAKRSFLQDDILPYLSTPVFNILKSISPALYDQISEIRLRVNQPLTIVHSSGDYWLQKDGKPTISHNKAYICTMTDLCQSLQLISQNSLYAYENEIKAGFITINGGHRVGLSGQAVVESGQIKTIRNISSMNFRIAREMKGCADNILPYIFDNDKQVKNTLIISPPRCGKTTVLRDLVRQLSSDNSWNRGIQVGLVDERSEVAACRDGVPTVDIGSRVDVLDGCPKAHGMLMMIRTMSPQVLATDEIGRHEDVYAVNEALSSGVSVIATVHGNDPEELLLRPGIAELISNKVFDCHVLLSSNPRPGTVSKIINAKTNKPLYLKGDK